MNSGLPSPLDARDLRLLKLARLLVPAAEREEWVRAWAAELWCVRHGRRRRARRDSMVWGVFGDALWLHGERARLSFGGTATLCLLKLFLLALLCALPAAFGSGSWRGLGGWLAGRGVAFTVEAALVVFVSYATASAEIELWMSERPVFWWKAFVFQGAKMLLLLLAMFLLSADLCFPLRAPLPLTGELLQNMLFALFALLGLRWSFRDGDGRCKECLRALESPTRVGRPSYNFLEWNGTELECREGHGLLSVPELETSWCRASAWIRCSR